MISTEMMEAFQGLTSYSDLLEAVKHFGSERDAASLHEMLPQKYAAEDELKKNWFDHGGAYRCRVEYLRRGQGYTQEMTLKCHGGQDEDVLAVRFLIYINGQGVGFREAHVSPFSKNSPF